LLSLALACARDLNLLLSARRLREAYRELGFSIGERQLRNHLKWLLEREYIVIYLSRRGSRVQLTEKGERLLKALGLLKEVRA
jgi:repressor of nif and glnA expression